MMARCALVMMAWLLLSSPHLLADEGLIDTPEKAKAAQAAAATKLGKPVQWTNSIGMTFQLIPAGTFTMGSPGDASGGDASPHRVTISKAYYIGTTEVARKHYEQVLNVKYSFYFPGPDKPMNHVTLTHVNGGLTFIKSLNKLETREKDPKAPADAPAVLAYRLPTEAEWEYAARAGVTTDYPGGNDVKNLDAVAWYIDNSGNEPHDVGQKAPNAFGVHDMLGNLWEWCNDWYDADYYRASPPTDPTGPTLTLGGYRVLRGGAAMFGPKAARLGNRAFFQDSRGETHMGLRIVLPAE